MMSGSRDYLRRAAWVLWLSISIHSVASAQQDSPQFERAVDQMRAALREAGMHYTQQEFAESGKKVAGVQERLNELAADADQQTIERLRPLFRALTRAHALLELEGVELPVLAVPDPEQAMDMPGSGNDTDTVLFARDVAPILVAKCGQCHIEESRGQFNIATFADLMRGSAAGRVVFAGDALGSPLIDVIESGDMPRGGLQVSDEQLATLKQWVAAGASFDGSPNAPLRQLADLPAGEETVELQVMPATGEESVRFLHDLAPVLLENCNGCHIGGSQLRGGLNLSHFTGLLQGGESGPPIVPGDPEQSLLIRKLKGTAGQQMPAGGRAPLEDHVIAEFATWIREGASFDGPDPNQPFARAAALAAAQTASHEQLAAQRRESVEAQWRTALPGIAPTYVETDNFLLVGTAGEETLKEHARQAEARVPQIARLLGVPSDQPLVKGRMTVFIFSERYDYSEFGRMVERRSLPRQWQGHWEYNIIDAYAAILQPRGEDYSLEDLIAQYAASVHVAGLPGQPPRWFSEGMGRVVVERLSSSDPRVAAWQARLPGLLQQIDSPDQIFAGALEPEAAEIASYAFVDYLLDRRNARRTRMLFDALQEGRDFSDSFASIYGASPDQVAERWLGGAAAGGRGADRWRR